MKSSVIRNKLYQYVNEGDEELLKLMYAIAREYYEETEGDVRSEFTQEDIRRYEERRIKRLREESKTYGWFEAKTIIRGKTIT